MSDPRMFQSDADGFLIGGRPIDIPEDEAARDLELEALHEIGDSLESIDNRLEEIARRLGQLPGAVAVAPGPARPAVLPDGVSLASDAGRAVSAGDTTAPGINPTMPKPNMADGSLGASPRIEGPRAPSTSAPSDRPTGAAPVVVRVDLSDVERSASGTPARADRADPAAALRSPPQRDERGRFVSTSSARVTLERLQQPAAATGQVRPVGMAVRQPDAAQSGVPGARVDRRMTSEVLLRQMFGVVGEVPPASMIREVGGGDAAVPRPGRGVVLADPKRMPRQMRGAAVAPAGRPAGVVGPAAAGAPGGAGGSGGSAIAAAGAAAGAPGAPGAAGAPAADAGIVAPTAAGPGAQAVPADPAGRGAAAVVPPMPAPGRDRLPVAVSPRPYAPATPRATPAARDASGRFMPASAAGGSSGASASAGADGLVPRVDRSSSDPSRRPVSGTEAAQQDSVIKASAKAVAEGLAGTLKEAAQGNSERDPALKAAAEVGRLASPLANAGKTIFSRMRQARAERSERNSERWLSRIWRSVSGRAGAAGASAGLAGSSTGTPIAAVGASAPAPATSANLAQVAADPSTAGTTAMASPGSIEPAPRAAGNGGSAASSPVAADAGRHTGPAAAFGAAQQLDVGRHAPAGAAGAEKAQADTAAMRQAASGGATAAPTGAAAGLSLLPDASPATAGAVSMAAPASTTSASSTTSTARLEPSGGGAAGAIAGAVEPRATTAPPDAALLASAARQSAPLPDRQTARQTAAAEPPHGANAGAAERPAQATGAGHDRAAVAPQGAAEHTSTTDRQLTQHERTAQALREMREQRADTHVDRQNRMVAVERQQRLERLERQGGLGAAGQGAAASASLLGKVAVAPVSRGMFEAPAGSSMGAMPRPSGMGAGTGQSGVNSAAAVAVPSRMLRILQLIRSDQSRSDKAQLKVLREIERKPVAVVGAGGAGGLLSTLASAIPGAGKLAGAGGLLKGAAGGLLKRLPVIGALAGAAGVAGSLMGGDDPSKTPEQNATDRAERVGGAAGGLAGGLAGASSGAALGSLAGPVGTVVGGVVGGIAGSIGGEKIGEKLGGSIQEGLKNSGAGEKLKEVGQKVGDAAKDTASAARRGVAVGAANVADLASKAPAPIKDAARTVAGGVAAVSPAPVRAAGKAVAAAARNLVAEGNWEKQKANLVEAAQKAGVDPAVMARIANFESRFNPDAAPIAKDDTKNRVRLFDGRMGISSAHGLGQFTDASWQDVVNKYGGKYGVSGAGTRGGPAGNLSSDEVKKYRADPKIQAAMLAEFTRDNIEMGRKYGGNNDDANVYALHNLGLGDGKRLLNAVSSSPNVSVRDALIGGRDISDKERKRIESVISGNKSLYGDGSISAAEAYGRMGQKMAEGNLYADDATRMAGGAQGGLPVASGANPPAAGRTPSVPTASGYQPAAAGSRAAPSRSATISPADPKQTEPPADTGVAAPVQGQRGAADRAVGRAGDRPAQQAGQSAAAPAGTSPAATGTDAARAAGLLPLTQAVSSADTLRQQALAPVMSARQMGSVSAPSTVSSVPLPSARSIPDQPNFTMPSPTLNSPSKTPTQIELNARQPITQDVSDRSIAHIATGGLGKI